MRSPTYQYVSRRLRSRGMMSTHQLREERFTPKGFGDWMVVWYINNF